MAVSVIAEISATTRIIRLEPPHAVGHRVATVARLVGVGAVPVVGSSEQSADDGTTEQPCTHTPSRAVVPAAAAVSTAAVPMAAPLHGLDIRRGSTS